MEDKPQEEPLSELRPSNTGDSKPIVITIGEMFEQLGEYLTEKYPRTEEQVQQGWERLKAALEADGVDWDKEI